MEDHCKKKKQPEIVEFHILSDSKLVFIARMHL